LGELDVWGVAVPSDPLTAGAGASPLDGDVAAFRKVVDAAGLQVAAVTTQFNCRRAFTDGALAAPDREIRRLALREVLRALDLAGALGADVCIVAPEPGSRPVAARCALDALMRYREAVEFCCGYVRDRDLRVRLGLATTSDVGDPHAVLSDAGNAVAFVAGLDQPGAVGVAVTAADGAVVPALAQALAAGVLFDVDLRAPARSAPDGLFDVIQLLEAAGYEGPRHLGDVPACGGEGADGWGGVRGAVRTYLALAAKARRFADDPDIHDAVADCGLDALADETIGPYSPAATRELLAERFDPPPSDGDQHRAHLNQLVTELILGLR
jgi:xylose isomerase